MTLDEMLLQLVVASRELRRQIGEQEYNKRFSFELLMAKLRLPVGELPKRARMS
jgi:hypothetical protein